MGLDRRRDPERIVAVLREIDADVIALQEADLRLGERASTLPRALLDDTRWQVAKVARRARSIGWHGNALLVARDIAITGSEPLDLPTLEPRGAVAATCERDGARFRVVGTHLDLSGLRRSAQIKAMLGHCSAGEDCATVMMGDFNQWGRATGAMRHFGDGWTVLKTGASFPGRRPIAPLDRIAVTPHWRLIATRVHHSALAVQASDHLPVVAELELTA